MGGDGPLGHMIIDRRRANPILHLIQLIVLEYCSEILLDRREARRLHVVAVSLLMPPCVEKMSGVKELCSTLQIATANYCVYTSLPFIFDNTGQYLKPLRQYVHHLS